METIFFAHSINVIGGAERVTLSIIESVKEQYNTVMLAPSGNTLGEAVQNAGAKFQPVECIQPELAKPLKTLKQLYQYYKIFKSTKPKLVHVGDLLALRSLQPICKLMNIPMVCHVHFPYQASFIKWTFHKRYAPHTFIFCSEELKANLAPELSRYCANSEMRVSHNGVDTDKFFPVERAENKKPRIGIVANLQYRKGHDDFLAMAKALIDKGINAQFDIIGGDILEEPRESLLKQKAQDLGIAEHVVFHGQVDNVLELLHQLDVYVCASHEEAFPISILEAMACGKAIVSTNVNGIPEAITDNVDGLLSEAQTPTILAEHVKQLLTNASFKNRLKESARKKVVNNFSQERFEEKIFSAYNKI